jgi:hypothetical protein
MVKSHTECSAELVWQMVKKQNSFIRASVNNTRFSCEPGNVTNEHGFSSSGKASFGNTCTRSYFLHVIGESWNS